MTQKRILISSIIRNRANYLNLWLNQINLMIERCPDYEFFISAYENDSTDDSVRILKSLDFSKFKDFFIKTEKLNTPSFGSIKNDQRVCLLADARNKAIYDCNFVQHCDEVLFIEPDIDYDPVELSNIVRDHSCDILSAKSTHIHNAMPHEIYDAWASRIIDKDEGWPPGVAVDGFPKRMEVWSTFNCFCKYNAEPIKNKISFSGFNKRLNKYDCDTAVICENFREAGYNKVVLDGRYSVFHSRYN